MDRCKIVIQWRYLGVLILASQIWGCQPVATDHASTASRADADHAPQLDDVAPPPGLDAKIIMPRHGDPLQRARQSIDEILADLPLPSYLSADDDTSDQPEQVDDQDPRATEDIAEPEPPLSVQREYLAGRIAWRNRRQYQATQHLQAALRVCPRCPAILRLLGMIYIRTGNQPRGAALLEKAVQIDPQDIESLMLIGRYKASVGLWSEAIVTLATALRLDAPRADPALKPLLEYLLGNALTREGYDQAAIEHTLAFLQTPLRFDRTTRHVHELALLGQKRGSIWQLIGDAHSRLGQPEQALQAYRRAAKRYQQPRDELIRRMVFGYLRSQQWQAAKETVLAYMKAVGPNNVSVSLVRYLAEYGRFHDGFVDELRHIYEQEDRSAPLAITIADLIESDEATRFLGDHLRDKPGDRRVFEFLIRRLTSGPVEQTGQVRWALDATTQAIIALPTAAREYSDLLVESVTPTSVLRETILALPVKDQSNWAYRFILAKVEAGLGDDDRAIAHLEQVLEQNPDLLEARLQVADWLMDRGLYERAGQWLDGATDATNPQVIRQRVRLLRATGQTAQALLLLDRLISQQPRNMQLAIDKANLQFSQADATAAEKTLLAALDRQPTAEPVYEQLVELYKSGRISNAAQDYKKLLRRLWDTIPHSRIARLERARVLAAREKYDQAEIVLRELLANNPDDLKALDLLLGILVKTQRQDEANELVSHKLEELDNDDKLLTIALRYYRRVEDAPRIIRIANKLLARVVKEEPRDLQSIDALLTVIHEAGDTEQADQWIERHLGQEPEDQELLTLAQRHYARSKNEAKLFDAKKRYLLLQPASPTRTLHVAALCLENDQPEEAADRLLEQLDDPGDDPRTFARLLCRALNESDRTDEANKHMRALIDRFPQHAGDMKFDWAMLCERWGDQELAQRLLLDLLNDDPGHALANNALGYSWAVESKNLDRAYKMIEKAVQAEPDNPAYLDSMGWVLYKLGRFEEAVRWLERSRAALGGEYPVILDHLGDAQFRVGRPQEAAVSWKAAQHAFDQEGVDPRHDTELVGLKERLAQKIQAVEADRPPPIAQVPVLPADPPEIEDSPISPDAVDQPTDPADAVIPQK